ncbi:SPOR domain-containing protein [Saccharospirillum mangrovi]|uniref:SPOR domain-containing protein n=1 Tax=Saccharospirillum mangrovi TaxID=2161747 RepID=UPI000D3C0BCD|nr:SPOR domain-containing protein [Saccharospirillum mangrovi]
MKGIILTLLALNLAFGGWLYWRSQQPDADATQVVLAELNNLGLDEATRVQLAQSGRQRDNPNQAAAQCILIRGIGSADDASVIQARLTALEVPSTVSVRSEVVRTDHWVVLGPFESTARARERLAQLQADGVESFLINQGRLEGGISLGLFSSNSNAENRRAALAEAGIDARIEDFPRTREVRDLNIAAEAARLLSDGALESILDRFEGVDFQRYGC